MPLRGRKPLRDDEEAKVIEINAQMQGTLNFSDPVNLKINGEFSGSLETKGTLTIGNQAKVTASITGESIIIGGQVEGNITATKMLVLMPSAVLYGDIATPKLNIVEGAMFQGHCRMMSDNMIGIDEVAKYLEIGIDEIESLANSGKIPALRTGNSWQFERSQIDIWASSGRIK